MPDAWSAGERYEPYVGRWSRRVADGFLGWLGIPPGASWLDVGCGTGALTQTILGTQAPREVVGVDASPDFLRYAQAHANHSVIRFEIADARELPFQDATFHGTVSGLCLNFVPEPHLAAGEMTRVTKPGGMVGAYVWDYSEGMQPMRHFWDVAVEFDPRATELDEGVRFPLCRPDPLRALFTGAGLDAVEVREIVIPTVFRDFDDYWSPFLGGQGPAPGYAMSLSEDDRGRLRETLRERLLTSADGTIELRARAWAVRGLR